MLKSNSIYCTCFFPCKSFRKYALDCVQNILNKLFYLLSIFRLAYLHVIGMDDGLNNKESIHYVSHC